MTLFPLGSDEIASTVQGIFQQEEIFRFLNQNPPVKVWFSGSGIAQQMGNSGLTTEARIFITLRQPS